MRPDDALRHFAVGPGRDGARPQDMLTPPLVLGPLRALWGEIAYDPAGSRKHTIATRTAYEGGLDNDWPDRTYCNPPYKHLRDWLGHLAARSRARACMLAPVRPHRRWWREHVARCSCMVWLDPFAFWQAHPVTGELGPFVTWDRKREQYVSSVFPAPLCLLFTADKLAHVRLLFDHLGGVTLPPETT